MANIELLRQAHAFMQHAGISPRELYIYTLALDVVVRANEFAIEMADDDGMPDGDDDGMYRNPHNMLESDRDSLLDDSTDFISDECDEVSEMLEALGYPKPE